MSLTVNCPACGAGVVFKSRASVFAVCAYCRNCVALSGENPENAGRMSEMPGDMSPLQIGVSGKVRGRAFEIVGRVKMRWASGTWNEWYALFDDGRDAWIADAQGFYLLSEELQSPAPLPDRETLNAGTRITFAAKDYVVEDLRDAKCVASEGELSLRAHQGRESLNADLVSEDGEFLGLEYSANGVRVFRGGYIDFEEFHFQNLREFDGW